MIISSRRLLWGFNLLLLLTASLIYRPIRSWIDQAILAKAIHPNLQVQEIRFHGDQLAYGTTLMQAVQFDWGSNLGDRTVGLSADDAWFVIENEPLLDKRLVVPKAMLRGSRLYLNSNSQQQLAESRKPKSNLDTPGSLWQRHLDQRFGDLDWNALRRNLENLLSIDSFTLDCNQQVKQWLQRNQKIATHAQQLVAPQSQTQNPLRDEREFENLLKSLDQLFQEDQELSKEFGKIEQKVEQKFQQISEIYERQCELVKTPTNTPEDKAVQHDIAKELVKYAGQQVIRSFKDFGEVADLLCRAATLQTKDNQNQNLRTTDGNVVNLQNLVASGMFRCDQTRAPFHIRTRYQLSLPVTGQPACQATFRYQFETLRHTIRVQTSSITDQPDRIELKMAVTNDPATQTQWMDSQSDRDFSGSQWLLVCDSEKFEGTMLLDQILLPFLGDSDPKLAAAIATALDRTQKSRNSIDPIELKLSGTWQSPKCSVVTTFMPDWLLEVVTDKLKAQNQQHQREKVAQLESYFSGELERLYGGLNQLLAQAKNQTERNTKQMLAVRSQLQKHLTDSQNVEFARSKSQDVSR